MSEPVIRTERLGKCYLLGDGGALLSERLQRTLLAPLRLGRGGSPGQHEGFSSPDAGRRKLWAIRDVSIDIRPGEATGLIGPNGGGKSTLLKLISRITLPTEGRVTVRGRVATLLEVGTGFHPELTGRENIFINGAILGMRRREIAARFDEIVAFSGVERFIDVPVKRYSSGMFVRLAFSVAAHLQSEILLVDEVLAVGDAEFQQKCVAKMAEITESGRTVIFVTHDLTTVQGLCSRVFLIDRGHIVSEGTAADAVAAYLERIGHVDQMGGVAVIDDEAERFEGTGQARLRKVVMSDENGEPAAGVTLGQPIRVTMTLDVHEPVDDPVFEIGICTLDGTRFATVQSVDSVGAPRLLAPGTVEVTAEISMTLLPGEYALDVAVYSSAGVTIDLVHRLLPFRAYNIPSGGEQIYPWAVVRGYVRPRAVWSTPVSVPAPGQRA